MSILVIAILLLFGFNLISTLVSSIAQVEPWFMLPYGADIIGNILTDPYPQHIATSTFLFARSLSLYRSWESDVNLLVSASSDNSDPIRIIVLDQPN